MLPRSATNRRPCGSMVMSCGVLNSTRPEPSLPKDSINLPSLVNLEMRARVSEGKRVARPPRLSDQFDALIHFDKTRAVKPLELGAAHSNEVPETFPSGV